jgi:ferrous iron transport protein A
MNRAGNKAGVITLSDTKVGCEYELLGFDGGGGLRERINSMGLNSGAILRVIANSGHGPVGIEVKQARLGIGRGMAQKIKVRKVEIGN